ncbi:MAG TPA: transketolase C-terminal domain-containing protein [Xanthobacteraceae bacterium]|jgi:pyruvate dehydrogenase E1 component beta subunit
MFTDPAAKTTKLFFREAVSRALKEEMLRDSRLILLGQDIGRFGGSYREFAGLFEQFGPQRIRDMPVAEAAMVGIGIGAAAAGTRSLVSITYMDFLMLALDPLVNYAAKLSYKTAGQLRAPVVVKTTAGAKGQGVAHSQCIEAWLMSVPGLKVVAPATAAHAYGLLKASLREEGPVVFIDHKRLFPTAGHVPDAETILPLGVARVARHGSDVTLTSHSYMTTLACAAADSLLGEGIACEVIDLCSLAPLDVPTVCRSVAKTRALVTVEEGQITCGVGAEIVFRVHEQVDGFRVTRLGAVAAPVSSNPVLEAASIPDTDRICAAVRGLLAGDGLCCRSEPADAKETSAI